MSNRKKILVISTGGTFNKIYNPLNGSLEIDTHSSAIKTIASKWLCKLEVLNIIGKDSLEMDDADRTELVEAILSTNSEKIIIVHGTDTMDITAKYLANATLKKSIIITGAMVPYYIDPVEATANLASAYGYINALENRGIYIAMNGVVGSYQEVNKNRKEGRFTLA